MTTTSEAPEITVPIERIEARMVELASQIAGATCELLLLVGEYDAREGWRPWGMGSTSAWLSWKCGVGRRAAREQVRVARALRDYPQIVEPFRAGRLSYSKVRAITRVATPATIETLIDWALHAPAAQIERITAGRGRNLRRAEVRAQRVARSVSWRWDDDGTLVVSTRLPAEQGIRFLQALDAARDVLPDVPDEVAEEEIASAGAWRADHDGLPIEGTELDRLLAMEEAATPLRKERRTSADAFVEMIERAIASIAANADAADDGVGLPGLGAERFTLVMHTSGSAEPPGAGPEVDLFAEVMLTDGVVGLPSPVTRRLACSCSHATQVDDEHGNPLHVGRKTRRIRGRLARAVHARDGGRCRAPGCNNRTTQIHHIVHWADGGPTCIENLISLCDRHHWLVHEGEWTIGGPQGGWLFRSPKGKVLATNPEPPDAVVPLPRDPSIAADAIDAEWGPQPFSLTDAVGVLDMYDLLAQRKASA